MITKFSSYIYICSDYQCKKKKIDRFSFVNIWIWDGGKRIKSVHTVKGIRNEEGMAKSFKTLKVRFIKHITVKINSCEIKLLNFKKHFKE